MIGKWDVLWGGGAALAAMALALRLTGPGERPATPAAADRPTPAARPVLAAGGAAGRDVAAAHPAPHTAVTNLLPALRFHPGGTIRFSQEREHLHLRPSYGWLWASLPRIDLATHPLLRVTYTARSDAVVWLELKDAQARCVVGEPRHGMRKVRLELERTAQAQVVSKDFDMRNAFIDDSIRVVVLLALSDPTAELDVQSLGFAAR